MTGFSPYVKSYICECECAWTIEKDDPETCWFCESTGPHLVTATTENSPSFLKIVAPDEAYLFSTVQEVQNANR